MNLDTTFTNTNGEFDWNFYQADNAFSLKENKSIFKQKGDKTKVYCNLPYAQELYNLYSGTKKVLIEPLVGDIITGKIISVNEKSVLININWREDAMIDLTKENKNYLKYIGSVGDEVEVIIEGISEKNSKFPIMASYSKNIVAKKRAEIMLAIEHNFAYPGVVTELIHGGYFIDIDSVKCFMPGSLGGINKLNDFKSILGKTLYVVPINYSKEKDYIVVSHREYLKALIPSTIDTLEVGEQYDGTITGISKHGIFVEFKDCLTGLISTADMDEITLSNYNNFKSGMDIKFWLKNVAGTRLVLSLNKIEKIISPWELISTKYKKGQLITGKVVGSIRYGYFIEIEDNITGLLHTSNIHKDIEIIINQEITVKIIKIDKENKRIDFQY